MAKNTSFGRGRYNADYAPDSKGQYRYVGSYYRLELEGKKKKIFFARLLVLILLSVAAFAMGGLTNSPAGRTLYTLLPFMCCVLPLGYLLFGLVKLMTQKGEMTNKAMDESVRRIRHSAIGLMVCASLALVGGIVLSILSGGIAQEIVFLLACCLMLLLGLALEASIRKAPIRDAGRR